MRQGGWSAGVCAVRAGGGGDTGGGKWVKRVFLGAYSLMAAQILLIAQDFCEVARWGTELSIWGGRGAAKSHNPS